MPVSETVIVTEVTTDSLEDVVMLLGLLKIELEFPESTVEDWSELGSETEARGVAICGCSGFDDGAVATVCDKSPLPDMIELLASPIALRSGDGTTEGEKDVITETTALLGEKIEGPIVIDGLDDTDTEFPAGRDDEVDCDEDGTEPWDDTLGPSTVGKVELVEMDKVDKGSSVAVTVTVLITVIAGDAKDDLVAGADVDPIESEVVKAPEDISGVTTGLTVEVIGVMSDSKLDMTPSKLLISELRLAADALTTELALETAAATLTTDAALKRLDAMTGGIGMEALAASNCRAWAIACGG